MSNKNPSCKWGIYCLNPKKGIIEIFMLQVSVDRIISTKYDFVPLDRVMPLKTAVNIFEKEYKRGVKNFYDRKYQRLREVYFSLFVCRALDIMEGRSHLVMFHERQDTNDVSFIVPKPEGEVGDIRYFDVKEYVPWDKRNFDVYLSDIVKKSLLKDYELIIWVQNDIKISDLMRISWHGIEKHIFMINRSKENDSWFQCNVAYIQDGFILFNDIIDVSDLVSPGDPLMIYQDKINFKQL